MKYDHYTTASDASRDRIIRAQQILFGKILRGLRFSSALEIGPGFGGFAEYCKLRGIEYRAVEENRQLALSLQSSSTNWSISACFRC